MKILATKIILTVDGATLSDETSTTTMTDETKFQEATERNLSFSQNSSGINESILVFLVCPINLTFVCRPPMTTVGRRELSKERRRAWLLLWARPSFCHRPELHCSRPSRNSIRCRSHRSSRSRRNLRSLHSHNSLKSKRSILRTTRVGQIGKGTWPGRAYRSNPW